MNIQSVKQLIWTGALALSGWLAWEVYDFTQKKAEDEKYVDSVRVREASYDKVKQSTPTGNNPTVLVASLNNGFGNLNWSGKIEKPVPTPEPGPVKPVEQPKEKVAELLTITALGSIPIKGKSYAWVEFLNSALNTVMSEPSDHLLKEEERLKGKFKHIQVESIEVGGVRFKFDDESRESEFVPFNPMGEGGIKIALLGDGVVRPVNDALPSVSPAAAQSYRRPERTIQTRRNHFQIGTQSLEEVNRDYTRILSNDVRYRSVRNRSNKVKGIQVTDVKPGSIPAEAGLSPGEILISVNGHQVTSESELIAFIKRESANTTEWESIWELDGKQFTRYYTSPEN